LLLTSQLLLAQSSSNETKKPTSVSQTPQAEPSPNASLFEAQGNQGEEVIIAGSVSDDEAKTIYPQGWKSPKPYIRIVPQPK